MSHHPSQGIGLSGGGCRGILARVLGYPGADVASSYPGYRAIQGRMPGHPASVGYADGVVGGVILSIVLVKPWWMAAFFFSISTPIRPGGLAL